ncbi:carbohydrate-binding protein [Streptomyces tendae]|uniref:carbohydrate-binding protein n=1 Tax=Streptomyces tendae TaxID=1932 RepID=UPI00381771F7
MTNNLITRVDYRGSYAAGINVLGSDQTITHNTVTNSGRSNINIDNKVAGTTASGHEIAYNDLSDYGNLVVDVGAIYICCQVNLAGTEIHHNKLHDAALFAASAPAPGVYLDLSTYNATVYDNVAWNRTTYGVVLINANGGTTSGNRVYNNTRTDRKSVSLFPGTYSDTEVANNIGDADTMAGVSSTNNLPMADGPQFTNPALHCYTLGASSPARGYGLVRPPARDGYTDPKPSAGAYQYGATPWQAGVAVQRTTVQAESYAQGGGVATHAAGTGSVPGSFDGGDWVRYDDVDFGTGRDLLVASIGSERPYAGGRFEVRIDSATGPVVGTVRVENTGSWDTYLDQNFRITPTSGTHDVYLSAPSRALTAPLTVARRPRPPRAPRRGRRGPRRIGRGGRDPRTSRTSKPYGFGTS